MGLLRYVVQGFGWRIGREVAEEAIDEARTAADREPPKPTEAQLRKQERRRQRERAKATKAAARQEKQRQKTIDRDLADLKRRVARQSKA